MDSQEPLKKWNYQVLNQLWIRFIMLVQNDYADVWPQPIQDCFRKTTPSYFNPLLSPPYSFLSFPLIPLELTSVTSILLFSDISIKQDSLWTMSRLCTTPQCLPWPYLPPPGTKLCQQPHYRYDWYPASWGTFFFFYNNSSVKCHLHLYTCFFADLCLDKACLRAIPAFLLMLLSQ